MMHRFTLALAAAALASPAAAASGPFFSLANTDFIVLISFVIFVGVLFYFGVPKMIGGLLDKRAEGISAEIEEAKALQEEAKTLLAEFERKHQDVKSQADRIVAHAKEEAQLAADQAKIDLENSIARRLVTAEEQIASAEASAIKEVRDQAVAVAISAAKDVIANQMTAADGNKLIDEAIADVDTKLH